MPDEKQIPDAVVKALLQSLGDGWGIHAALAAALNAWPEAEHVSGWQTIGGWRNARLTLPLKKEGE